MFRSDIDDRYVSEERQFDRPVIVGITLCIILIFLGALVGGKIGNFIDLPAILIVGGGTFGATLIHFPVYDLVQAWRAFTEIMFEKSYPALERIDYLVELSSRVRKDGILVMENESRLTDDSFLKRAFELTVDGQSQADIKRVLETEMRSSNQRNERAIQVFQTMATYAPALGLIGTLIGLIQMLDSLNDPSSIGPAMSVALVTTLYGALFANLLFLPTAGKLKNRNDQEALVRAITLEGILAIGGQENPIVVEQRLLSYMPLSSKEVHGHY